jgi:hypothetical protein
VYSASLVIAIYHLPFAIYHFDVVIRASAASEIRALVLALGGTDEVMCEAAIARLAVIGSRAVDRLIAAYDDHRDTRARLAILRALEAIGDPRAIQVAQQALAAGGDLSGAGAGLLRALLDSRNADVSTTAFDTLVGAIVDPGASPRTRAAALDALQDMPVAVRARVAAAVESDTLPMERARRLADPADADLLWADAVEGRMPDDAAALKPVLQARGTSASLAELQKMIDRSRGKESDARAPAEGAGWMDLRGALHRVLALRGSKIGLYDLRESFAGATGPLPVAFLAAMQVLGDASCLEPIAAAYRRAGADDTWWRQQLAAVFREICKRERITKRHGVLKRVAARCPALVK